MYRYVLLKHVKSRRMYIVPNVCILYTDAQVLFSCLLKDMPPMNSIFRTEPCFSSMFKIQLDMIKK